MIVRLVKLFWRDSIPHATRAREGLAPPTHSRRRAARSSLAWGLVAFVLATAGLAAAVETVKPEWRDPEFGRRLRRIEQWKAESPDRPLVLVLGSSRTQMGISPAAMGFPDGPSDPFVYNFGMIGARNRMLLLNLIRIRDAGITPAAVLIELVPHSLVSTRNTEGELLRWADRLTDRDLRLIAPYAGELFDVRLRWAGSRINALPHFRLRLMSDWAGEWLPVRVREDAGGDRLDRFGYIPNPIESFSPARLTRAHNDYFVRHKPLREVAEETDRAIRDLIEWCRRERVPVAFYWVPESPAFQGFYGVGEREVAEAYARKLVQEMDVPVFLPPGHLVETDFADGYHLLPAGAAKYSRWLADTHLKPWLAAHSK